MKKETGEIVEKAEVITRRIKKIENSCEKTIDISKEVNKVLLEKVERLKNINKKSVELKKELTYFKTID